MGVHGLWELLSPVGERVPNSHVRNKRMAVDASIWLTQFIRALREADGAQVANAHLIGVFRRCCKLLFLNVKPVLVFDGATPALKRRTRELRRAQHDRDIAKLRRLAERLLMNNLRQAAVGAVSDAVRKRSRRSNEPGPRRKRPRVVNPPTPPEESENDDTGNKVIDEPEVSIELPEDVHEIDDEALVNLPSNVQAAIFKQIRQAQRAQHREQVMARDADPESFSKAQIAGFMKNSLLNRRIRTVRNTINDNSGANQRIASDSSRAYLLEEGDHVDEDENLEEDENLNFDDSGDEQPARRIEPRMLKEDQQLDVLTRIRIQRERKQKENESVRKQNKATNNNTDAGLGWASKVLQLNGEHKLGGDDEVSFDGKRDSDEESDEWEDSVPTGFGSGKKSDDGPKENFDSDSDDWEDPIVSGDVRNLERSRTEEWKPNQNDHDLSVEMQEALFQSSRTLAKHDADKDAENDALPSFVKSKSKDDRLDPSEGDIVGVDRATVQNPDSQIPDSQIADVSPATNSGLHRNSSEEVCQRNMDRKQVNVDKEVRKGMDENPGEENCDGDEVCRISEGRESDGDVHGGDSTDVVTKVHDSTAVETEPNAEGGLCAYEGQEYNPTDVGMKATDSARGKASLNSERREDDNDMQDTRVVGTLSTRNDMSDVFNDDPAVNAVEESRVQSEAANLKATMIDTEHSTLNESEENNDADEVRPAIDTEEIERMRNDLERERDNLIQQQNNQQRTVGFVSDEMVGETCELLRLFGIPFVQAPFEAEAQCAFLDQSGLVDGVITEDSDAFLFGARTVYRQLFANGKFAEAYASRSIERELGIDRKKLIQLAQLLGSDYAPGVRGIGIVNAMEVVQAFPGSEGLQEFFEWTKSVTMFDEKPEEELLSGNSQASVRRAFCWKHRVVKRNWVFKADFPNSRVDAEYENPPVNRSLDDFRWGDVDFDGLQRFCWQKLGWNEHKFNDIVGPLRSELQQRKKRGSEQRRIQDYFRPFRFAKIKSERLQKAVRGLAGESNSNHIMAESTALGTGNVGQRKQQEENELDALFLQIDEEEILRQQRERNAKPSFREKLEQQGREALEWQRRRQKR